MTTTPNSMVEQILKLSVNEAHKALDRAGVETTKWMTHSVTQARQQVTLSLAERIDILARRRKSE